MYGASSSFPTNSYNGTNYWVDVMFAFPAPGQPTNATAVDAGRTSATVSWTAPSTGGSVASYKVTPYVGVTPQTPTTITGSPPNTSATIGGLTNGTTYTFTVQALNPNGGGAPSAQSNAVTPLSAVAPPPPTSVISRPATKSALVSWTTPTGDGDSPITGYTITPYVGATAQTPVTAGPSATSTTVSGLTNGTSYTFTVRATNAIGTGAQSAPSAVITPQNTILAFPTPATVDAGDGNSVELGVKFKADFNGSATGVRFYKAAGNTGTHIGSLWTTSGTRLAQATFTGESASGWQTVTFSGPVPLTAGATYVASYFAPNGHYSVNSSAFSSAASTSPPLHAIADSTSANGVFAYSPTSVFPSNSYNAGNYWVDVAVRHAGSRHGDQRRRDRGQGVGDRVVGGTCKRRGRRVVHHHAVRREPPRRQRRRSTARRRRQHRHHRPCERHVVHVPRVRRQHERLRSAVGPLQRGHAAWHPPCRTLRPALSRLRTPSPRSSTGARRLATAAVRSRATGSRRSSAPPHRRRSK